MPLVERVTIDSDSGLAAGPGDARLEITGVASNGDIVLATGTRTTEDATSSDPLLLRSADGRGWESVDVGSALPADGRLSGVVVAGDTFVAIGQLPKAGRSVALRSDDGLRFEATPLPFPESTGGATRYAAVAVAAAGDSVFVLGVSLDIPAGTSVRSEDIDASLALLRSDDGGATWAPTGLPPTLAGIESSGVFDRTPGAGIGGSALTLVGHGDELIMAVSVPGRGGAIPTTTLWRSSQHGAAWEKLGATDDMFDGEPVDLLHSHGGLLLAFTTDGRDASAWRSDDGGARFDRIDLSPAVLGGSGSQAVDAAVTLDDGTLVAVGHTAGERNSRQQPAELELWVTPDLEQWERALTDVALAGDGVHRAIGAVALGEQVVVLGAHEREATAEEIGEFEASIGRGAPPAPLARDGAAWIVSLEDKPVGAAVAQVASIGVEGFDGDVTINDMISFDGDVLAAGWVGGDEGQAAIWTSSDGRAWEKVSSPALAEPAGQRIYALAESEHGLVAVGHTVDEETRYLGVWTSADGRRWVRSDLASPEFESAIAYGAVQTDGGLLAVGEYYRPGDGLRAAGMWRSADRGQTWSPVDTTAPPFGAQDVEVLFDVVAVPDGRLVAAGHTGEAERTENGFTYSRRPYVIESADGESWAAAAAPYADLDFGEVLALAVDQGEAVGLGWFDRTLDELPDEPRVFASGIAWRRAEAWLEAPEYFRHQPLVDGSAQVPSGLVVTGRWFRGAAGEDPLIGVIADDSITFVGDAELIADRDQHAVAAAPLGDRVVVLGLDTTGDDAPAVVGWVVTPSPGS